MKLPITRLLIVAWLCILPCAHAQPPQTQAKKQHSAILVMSSFPKEFEAIETLLLPKDPSKVKTKIINGITFKITKVHGQRCVFCQTGMSLVNAASTTQLALDHFPIRAVFFTGIAGGVNPAFGPGDVMIPANWHYHSETAYFNKMKPGEYEIADWFIPKYKNFGMIFPQDPTVIPPDAPKDKKDEDKYVQVPSFPADKELLAKAQKAIATMAPIYFQDQLCQVHFGQDGVSGTVFCDNAEYRQWVFEVWKSDCLDMESAAIAQVCWQNQTPCLIIRGLSDLAGAQKGKNPVELYLKAASENSAAVLVQILKNNP